VEPVNWAYIAKSGHSQAPADPLFTGTFSNPNFAAVNPDYGKDLLMSPGDRVRIHLHDTAARFRADLTTHQSGSMTASTANGFAHVLYTPNASTCTSAPYAFHPEYSTANPRGNTWSAHTYNLVFSDEIGHFESCLQIDADFNCAVPTDADRETGLDEDDDNNFCVPASDSLLIKVNGCFSADEDFDGQSYQRDWPGTNPNVKVDRRFHPEPVRFTSATTRGHNYPRIAFETDLPRIEAADAQDNPPFCDRTTGANCVNPPPGAKFYPSTPPRISVAPASGSRVDPPTGAAVKAGRLCRRCGHHHRCDCGRCRDRFALLASSMVSPSARQPGRSGVRGRFAIEPSSPRPPSSRSLPARPQEILPSDGSLRAAWDLDHGYGDSDAADDR
jgi:hypothetical protein